MLVFTRKKYESFIIGNNVKVTILGHSNNGNVRIGVDAPKFITVHREEIWEKIQQELKGDNHE